MGGSRICSVLIFEMLNASKMIVIAHTFHSNPNFDIISDVEDCDANGEKFTLTSSFRGRPPRGGVN